MPVRVPAGPGLQHSAMRASRLTRYATLRSCLHPAPAVGDHSTAPRMETRRQLHAIGRVRDLPAARDATDRLELGRATLDDERREIMLRRDLGLTKLYNLVNDPDDRRLALDLDVARLRAIHVELRRGRDGLPTAGTDIDLGPRLPHLPSDGALDRQPGRSSEILDRLWRRTTSEPRLRARPVAGRRSGISAASDDNQASLFGDA